eukprot:CAMPEP_0180713620 /NCGR_PEP_ID=MMETSP1038_2-20121128/11999_1 /TAXON_ID=632150 /ORGANISM="Azadinium spinosum, Strain 3D9" /LENGTH=84 /DNA_ID=CAMNT_0022745957 /DNA_START=324 /DNA_END=578 /DNA_ORIENTATION=+
MANLSAVAESGQLQRRATVCIPGFCLPEVRVRNEGLANLAQAALRGVMEAAARHAILRIHNFDAARVLQEIEADSLVPPLSRTM